MIQVKTEGNSGNHYIQYFNPKVWKTVETPQTFLQGCFLQDSLITLRTYIGQSYQDNPFGISTVCTNILFVMTFVSPGEFCQLCATFLVEDPDMETMKKELKDAFRYFLLLHPTSYPLSLASYHLVLASCLLPPSSCLLSRLWPPTSFIQPALEL